MNVHINPLDQRKRDIETTLARLSDAVQDAIGESVRCLFKQDRGVCENLMSASQERAALRRQIDQACLATLAMLQPVAHDLRDLIAEMQIAGELERIGDYAGEIASAILKMDRQSVDALGLLDVQSMASLCQQMLSQALRAHREQDQPLALRINESLPQQEALLQKLDGQLTQAMRTSPEAVQNAIQMLRIAYNLARCARRAADISQQVLFRLGSENTFA